MFDIQYEVELLQTRLMDALALDCLDSEMLQEAMVDLGYINCTLQHNIAIESWLYEELLESIEAYERKATL